MTDTDGLSELGKAAVRYAENGFAVFPLRARGKRPATQHGVNDWTDETLKAVLNDLAVKLGVKTGQVFLPLRLAITGAATTPGGATEMAELFGKEETLKRLDFSIDLLSNAIQ